MKNTEQLSPAAKRIRTMSRIAIGAHVILCLMFKLLNRAEEDGDAEVLAVLGVVWIGIALVSLALGLGLLFMMWRQVPKEEARTTPARAALLLLVPFFNLYWFFVAFGGLAEDLNKTLQKKGAGHEVSVSGVRGICAIYIVFICMMVYAIFGGTVPTLIDAVITWGWVIGRWTLIEILSGGAIRLANAESDGFANTEAA